MIKTKDSPLFDSEVRTLAWFFESSQKPPIRPIYQFACEEVIIPEGRYKGRKYKPERQPFGAMLLSEMDRDYWRRIVVTGCVQSGKTFTALVIPFLWHIFEIQEDVIIGIPEMESAYSKWSKEFLPAIKANPKFEELLPDSGRGSKGGKFESLQFKHGPIVRFMSGQGKDEKRSGETARVLLATEVDKYDTAGDSSRETNPIAQMEARTESYEERARIILECTVSIPTGCIWSNYQAGSASRIACLCPHCLKHVTPEREDFTRHSAAKDEIEAEELAGFDCPECKRDITDHREQMNRDAILLHKGQEIVGDEITGGMPRTRTLGFRWNAFNNLFWSAPYLGRNEWKEENGVVSEGEDEELGSKKSIQFRWTKPYELTTEAVELLYQHIQERTIDVMPRGKKPDGTELTIIGIDVNKPVLHWTATSFGNQSGHVIDYGKTGVPSKQYGFEVGIKKALRHLQQKLGAGWSDTDYDLALVDCRWKSKEIIAAIKELKDKRFVPYFGNGSGHMVNVKYAQPKRLSKRGILWIGKHCYIRWDGDNKVRVLHGDANEAKTELAERFQIDENGKITIFGSTDDNVHKQFFNQLTAEKMEQRFERGVGWKLEWVVKRTSNHWLDSSYMTIVGAYRKKFDFAAIPKAAKAKHGTTVVKDLEETKPRTFSLQGQ